MTAPTDTQRRLLAAIATRIPVERVHELYLFAPLRQGGMETGIAVVASGESPPDVEPTAVGASVVLRALSPGMIEGDLQTPALVRAVMDAAEAAVEATADAVEAPVELPPHDHGDAPEADEVNAVGDPIDDVLGESPGEIADDIADDVADDVAAGAVRPARFTIYTARYRLQLKGPDRGKWEADVVEEADAPLLTVDAVVRGVQRRAGDEAQVERITGDDLRRLLAEPA